MEFEERPISSKTVFHGHLIDVEVQQVITPHGNRTQREIVHHAPAIAILALTADNKMILDALHAAKRELNEETRYEATSLKKISSFYTSVGCMDEYMTLYLATGLKRVSNELPQDQDEQLMLKEVTLPQALEMIDQGEIEDAKTIMAIYYWQGMNNRG